MDEILTSETLNLVSSDVIFSQLICAGNKVFLVTYCIVNNSVVIMPLVKPPRDLSKVRCVKKIRDKNGEIRHDLRVMFDYVRSFLIVQTM